MQILDELEPGITAVIKAFDIENMPLKLIEMGCLPGNQIMLIQKAPFSDPLYIKLDQSHLAISREIAKHIIVEPA